MDSKDTFYQQFPETLKQNIQDISKTIHKATKNELKRLQEIKKQMLFYHRILSKAKEGGI